MDAFWPSLSGAVVGAAVGAIASWIFALDLRRREREERELSREQERVDRDAEREYSRQERDREAHVRWSRDRVLALRGGVRGTWSLLSDWVLAESTPEREAARALFIQALTEVRPEVSQDEDELWWKLRLMAENPIDERLATVAELLQDYLIGWGHIVNPIRAAEAATDRTSRSASSGE